MANTWASCTVCGHIHDHTDEASVSVQERTCGDCGYCARKRCPAIQGRPAKNMGVPQTRRQRKQWSRVRRLSLRRGVV